MSNSIWKRYGYGWVTLGFFVISLIGHWLFGWFAYVDDQRQHGAPPEIGAYVVEMTRDTLENWQSEFLQLLWQIGGLAFLLYVGSPQSKEGDDRMEAKLDAILLYQKNSLPDRAAQAAHPGSPATQGSWSRAASPAKSRGVSEKSPVARTVQKGTAE